jgi:hypothetical protein
VPEVINFEFNPSDKLLEEFLGTSSTKPGVNNPAK